MHAEKVKSYDIPRKKHMEYFLSQDNSCHWVLVPQPIRAWWFKYLEIPDDDERSWVYPEGCIDVGGGPEQIVFSNFRAAKVVDSKENDDNVPA